MGTFSSFICNNVSPLLSIVALLLLSTGIFLFYQECSFSAWIPFVLIGCFCLGVSKYYESKSLVDAIVVFGVLFSILGIWATTLSSKEILDKTSHALYPQHFKARVNWENFVLPSDSKIHEIIVTHRNLGYEDYGFQVTVDNFSTKFPAQNVYVRVFFEKDSFSIDEQKENKKNEEQEKLKTSTDNEKILRAIRKKWSKPGIQVLTTDPLILGPKITGEAVDKELIGIGFVLPIIWKQSILNYYLPIEVRLTGDNGLIAIMINEKKFIFRYRLKKG